MCIEQANSLRADASKQTMQLCFATVIDTESFVRDVVGLQWLTQAIEREKRSCYR